MAIYTFPVEVDEQNLQRTWCDKEQQRVGRNGGPIQLREDEHLGFCRATEAQIRGSPFYNEMNPQHQRGLIMLEGKKDIILDAFMRLGNPQLGRTYALSMD